MNFHQLGYVIAVAESRHFTRAAENLGVAQPSLSAAIRSLELELGSPLFNRTRGDVSLTPAGTALLPIARRILADEAIARAEVASLVERRAGHVRLGATPSLSAELLPGILQTFRRRYDRIGVTLVEGGSRNLAESLASGELDLALMILPLHRGDTMLSATALIEEKLVLSAAANILGRPGGDISVDRLKGVPMLNYRAGYSLRETLKQACQDAGFEPNVVVDGGEMNSVVAMAEAGVGACLLPTTVARRAHLVSYNLISDRMTRIIGVAYRRGIVPSSAVRALLTVIDEQLASARFPAGIKVTGRARAQLD